MNEANEKEGIVIDVAPEREPAPEPPREPPPAPSAKEARSTPVQRRFGAGLGIGLGVLAFALVSVGLFLVYQSTHTMQADLADLNERLGTAVKAHAAFESAVDRANQIVKSQRQLLAAREREIDTTLTEQRQALNTQTTTLAEHEQRLAEERRYTSEREAELRAAIADVHRRLGGSGNQWMVAEADYLIRLARHRLNLSHDVYTASEALIMANERLRDTHDPGWLDVRDQIASDIAALAAVESPDYDGLSAQLGELLDTVPMLRLTASSHLLTPSDATQADPTTQQVSVRNGTQETGMSRAWSDFWGGLKNSVRIRRHDQSERALLTPEHALFVRQNVALHLAAARLGLIRKDTRLYRDSLASTRSWVEQFFDTEHTVTKTLLGKLGTLSDVDVRPELPDISRSLRALTRRVGLLRTDPPPTNKGPDSSTDVAQ